MTLVTIFLSSFAIKVISILKHSLTKNIDTLFKILKRQSEGNLPLWPRLISGIQQGQMKQNSGYH